MKKVLASLALAALASVTWATPGNNGGGNGGCGVGQQNNGCPGSAPVTNSPVANGGTGIGLGVGVGIGVGQGGAGGQGGEGGRGGAGGNANVLGSGNSNNTNVLGQQQGQMQGQQQGQAQSSRNSNRNTATGGNGFATGGQATGGNGTGGNSGGNVITVEGDKSDFYAASVIPKGPASSAAPVYVNPPSSDVCQRAGFGLSLQGYGGGGALSAGGSESDTCETRADAVNLKFTGAPEAVIRARQCQNAKIAKAFEDAGIPCKSGSKVSGAASAVLPASAVASSQEPSDPFIRQRLGLPALR